MAEASLHQSLGQQQSLAPQMRRSLEILQANSMELQQLVQQALDINPVLEDITESISLDENQRDRRRLARSRDHGTPGQFEELR